jgi:hypothetical protein
MARYKPQDRNSLLLPVVLSEQIAPASVAFALNYLVDNELNLGALDAQFKNDKVGASAYDPRDMFAIDGLNLPSNASEEAVRTREFLTSNTQRKNRKGHAPAYWCQSPGSL